MACARAQAMTCAKQPVHASKARQKSLSMRLAAMALWCGTYLVLPGGSSAADPPVCFRDGFDLDQIIDESGPMAESASPDWRVTSGGRFQSAGGLGMTLQGLLPQDDRWRLYYAAANPVDTDDGYRPQNVFRIQTRSQWLDLKQQVQFRIRAINLSGSPSRQGYNGVFLFQRFVDENNVYYTGLRVDGTAVVKRKLNGAYTTLAFQRVYPGTYNRSLNPSLLPLDRWIGMRTFTWDQPDGSVKLQVDVNDPAVTGRWATVLEVADPGGTAIRSPGHGGIRTDFMDVEFDDYSSGGCCDASLSPTSEAFGPAGGAGAVAVTALAGCAWSAVSNVTWITITDGSSGSGNGTVAYYVQPHRCTESFSGTLTIGGETFTVEQAGNP